ncbi:MAG: class I SAM-dependent methyltransferase [Dehalococcoidia bacterium]
MRGSREIFEHLADRYEAWFASPEGRVLFPTEVEALRPLLHSLPQPWLEVGVGTGAFAQAQGVPLGVDPARPMLAYARRRGIQVVQGVGERLPFRSGVFGGVLMVVTICFVEDALQTLRECARVLKTGGGLVVGEVERESAWGRLYQEKGRQGHPFYAHARFYTWWETGRLMLQAGLRLVRFSSTLCQGPPAPAAPEPAQEGIAPHASFVALLAVKDR